MKLLSYLRRTFLLFLFGSLFVDGLMKGALPIMLIALMWPDAWILKSTGMMIAICVAIVIGSVAVMYFFFKPEDVPDWFA